MNWRCGLRSWQAALCLTIFPLVAFASEQQTADPASHFYLSLADEYDRPLVFDKRTFGCEDKIFAVAELKHFPRGKHELTVEWHDPAGTLREKTRYPFHINQNQVRLWSWLSLRRGSGAGMFRWLDPSAGLEEFIGLWQVKVRVDGKKLANLEMEIHC